MLTISLQTISNKISDGFYVVDVKVRKIYRISNHTGGIQGHIQTMNTYTYTTLFVQAIASESTIKSTIRPR